MITTLELYEGYGFNLIPMDADNKAPSVKWKHYHDGDGQRVDAAELQGWIENFQNFAVLTGSWSGIVVIDCDSKEAYEFARSFCPPTPMEVLTSVKDHETGWRGRHLYYAHPGTWVHNKAGIYRNPDNPDKADKIKLDVRGDGGYVLAPYAKHKSGTLYEPTCSWHPDLLTALPTFDWDWFPEHARPGWTPPPSPTATRTTSDSSLCTLTNFRRGQEWIAKRDPAIQGQAGDQHTFLTARNLFEMGLSESEVLELMLQWNSTCVPPWGENALRRKVAHAARKGAGVGKATPIYEKKLREQEGAQRGADPSVGAGAKAQERGTGQASVDTHSAGQATATATAPRLEAVDLAEERKKRDKRPKIVLEDNLDREIAQVVRTLKGLNAPPWLFERHGEIVHLVFDSEEKSVQIETLTEVGLRTLLSQKINFQRYIKEFKEERTRSCSKLLSEAFIAQPWLLELPSLDRVVTLPQMSADGSLCTVPGYDPVTRTYYSPLPGQEMEEIPEVVTEHDIKEAKHLILDQMLADYQWQIDGKSWDGEPCSASLPNALTIAFEPVLRSQMPKGTFTPLRLIQAPDQGSGKTFLARALILAAQGYPASKFNPPDRYANREWSHEIIRVLRDPSETVLIDNMKGNPLQHAEMDTVMTDERYSARGMYTQKSVHATNNKMWVATGNNAELTPDIARRTIFIGIDPLPKTLDERDLTVGPIDQWISKNFVRVARAIRILVRGWIQAGRPRWRELRPEVCAGKDGARANVISYTEWGEIMGGMMDWLGVEGFYTNHEEAASTANITDQETAEWFAVLAEQFGEREFKVSDTIEHLEKFGTSEMYLLHSLALSDDYRTQRRATLSKLGKWFSSRRGQVRGGVKLMGGVGRLGRSYRLSILEGGTNVRSTFNGLNTDEKVDHPGDHGDRGRSWSKSGTMITEKPLQMELPGGSDHGDRGFVHESRMHMWGRVHAHARMRMRGSYSENHDHHDHHDHETNVRSTKNGLNTDEKVDHHAEYREDDLLFSEENSGFGVDHDPDPTPDYPGLTPDHEDDRSAPNGLNTDEKVDRPPPRVTPSLLDALSWAPDRLRAIRGRALEFQIWEQYCSQQFGKPDYPIRRPSRRKGGGYHLEFTGYSRQAPRRHVFVQKFWDALYDGAETREEGIGE